MKKLAAIVLLTVVAVIGTRADRTNRPTAQPPLPPPMPPLPRYLKVNNAVLLHELSPVAYFRVLLGMTPTQREKALAQKPATERETILRKIAEYEALPAEVREARLRHTELRWVLISLMKQAPAERTDRLRNLSAADRQFVEDRLRQWDQLPAADQKTYLEKQDFVSFYLRWQNANAVRQIEILSKLPPAQRTKWNAELGRWQNMPEQTRRDLVEQVNEILDTNSAPRAVAVAGLSERERVQIETSLRAYAQLSPDQRRLCVQSFGKFASMSPAERADFLQNAARWEEMTPLERRLWRQLVNNLPPLPPLPANLRTPRPGGLPPLPPGFPTTALAPDNVYARSVTN